MTTVIDEASIQGRSPQAADLSSLTILAGVKSRQGDRSEINREILERGEPKQALISFYVFLVACNTHFVKMSTKVVRP